MMNKWKSSLFCPQEQRLLWTRWYTRAPLSLRLRARNRRRGKHVPSFSINCRCRSWYPSRKFRLGRLKSDCIRNRVSLVANCGGG